MKKIAINGFGRIGRAAFKIALEHTDEIEVVAINDLFDTQTLAYLLKYDTVYGIYPKTVTHTEQSLIVDGKELKIFSEREPEKLPWGALGVHTVIESTGVFRTAETMERHLKAGAKQVILSAPPKEGVKSAISTHVLGVSDIEKDPNPLKSCASCTTNSIAPVVDVIHKNLGIKKATLTTVHGYTADQNLVDAPHKDFRRGRAAAENIVPTSTGAAISVTEVIPDLVGKFDGIALRVPVAVGSLSDVTILLERTTTKEEVNALLKQASESPQYKGILGVTEDKIVSSDILQTSYSGIVDLSMTQVVDGDLLKILSWYDNEWGYTSRLIEAVIRSI